MIVSCTEFITLRRIVVSSSVRIAEKEDKNLKIRRTERVRVRVGVGGIGLGIDLWRW
jgi:hypothetical protein